MLLKIIFLALLCIPLLYISLLLMVKLIREIYSKPKRDKEAGQRPGRQ